MLNAEAVILFISLELCLVGPAAWGGLLLTKICDSNQLKRDSFKLPEVKESYIRSGYSTTF